MMESQEDWTYNTTRAGTRRPLHTGEAGICWHDNS